MKDPVGRALPLVTLAIDEKYSCVNQSNCHLYGVIFQRRESWSNAPSHL
jgi:hypothetical protein